MCIKSAPAFVFLKRSTKNWRQCLPRLGLPLGKGAGEAFTIKNLYIVFLYAQVEFSNLSRVYSFISMSLKVEIKIHFHFYFLFYHSELTTLINIRNKKFLESYLSCRLLYSQTIWKDPQALQILGFIMKSLCSAIFDLHEKMVISNGLS